MREYAAKIKESLFYLVGFMLACDIYATPITIVLFAACWLIEGNLRNKFKIFLSNKVALLFVAFYVLHVIGLAYTKSMSKGVFDLEVKLSLLIFPIILSADGQMDFYKQKKFFYAFTIGLICNGLYCLVYATWRYFAKNEFVFQYMEFSRFLHPSYYSMYIDVALVWMFNLLTLKFSEIRQREKNFIFLAIPFLVFLLILLQSKTGIIISVLVFLVMLVRFMVLKKKWAMGLLILAATCAIGFVVNKYVITSNRSRLANMENMLSSQKWDSTSIESTQIRHFAWVASGQLVKENPAIGVGTGQTMDVLQVQYTKDGFKGLLAMPMHINTLNEYLEVAVTLGIVGAALLAACLLIPLYKSIKEKRFVYLMFLVLLMVNFLTESMLETQGGTMFYGLFNSLLMFTFVI